MGHTGKSVARSYMAALDCLIPVEASISGSIALNKDKSWNPGCKSFVTGITVP